MAMWTKKIVHIAAGYCARVGTPRGSRCARFIAHQKQDRIRRWKNMKKKVQGPKSSRMGESPQLSDLRHVKVKRRHSNTLYSWTNVQPHDGFLRRIVAYLKRGVSRRRRVPCAYWLKRIPRGHYGSNESAYTSCGTKWMRRSQATPSRIHIPDTTHTFLRSF